jgi:4'-phosphopantetheinyl transferase
VLNAPPPGAPAAALVVAVEPVRGRPRASDLKLLCKAELERAAGMASARRDEFIRGRSLLRRLVAAEVGGGPRSVPLGIEPAGRLRVAGARVGVSLSHTAGWTAAALARGREVGIDVQAPPLDVDERLIHRCCGDDTVLLLRLPPRERAAAFARIWAVQEACVKAAGQGLAGAPWRVPVPIGARVGTWRDVRWQTLDALEPAALAVATGEVLGPP